MVINLFDSTAHETSEKTENISEGIDIFLVNAVTCRSKHKRV